MNKLGFKEINQENWLEPDSIMKCFVKTSSWKPKSDKDWLSNIFHPKLQDSVPQDVQALFEVARGAMTYGYFFYPLFTLASDQLFRVAEAAVSHKCKALEAPASKKTFNDKIKWLADAGIISQTEWDVIRKLRNDVSHPERQWIFTPAIAIGTVAKMAENINSLFNVQKKVYG